MSKDRLPTFIPRTSINNESQSERYNLMCIFDRVQSQYVQSGFTMHTLAPFLYQQSFHLTSYARLNPENSGKYLQYLFSKYLSIYEKIKQKEESILKYILYLFCSFHNLFHYQQKAICIKQIRKR